MMTYWSDASQDNEIFVIEEVDIRNDTKANDGESKDLYNESNMVIRNLRR